MQMVNTLDILSMCGRIHITSKVEMSPFPVAHDGDQVRHHDQSESTLRDGQSLGDSIHGTHLPISYSEEGYPAHVHMTVSR